MWRRTEVANVIRFGKVKRRRKRLGGSRQENKQDIYEAASKRTREQEAGRHGKRVREDRKAK
jgi:hypothetical protein